LDNSINKGSDKNNEINRLLKQNINISKFMNFVEKGDIDTVKRLINENRELVFIVDDYGNTALHLAVLGESEKALAMAKLLLENGAEISKKNNAGYNPLALVEDKSLEISQLLQKQVQSSSYWRKPIALIALIMLILVLGAIFFSYSIPKFSANEDHLNPETSFTVARKNMVLNINEKDEKPSGDIPLHIQLKNKGSQNDPEAIQQLIDKGTDINAKDQYGNTTLHYAVRNGNKETVKFLLEEGADVNSRDKYGKTPLFNSVVNDDIEIVKMLIAKGADIKAKDKAGQGILCCRQPSNKFRPLVEVVEFFINKGADPDMRYKDGKRLIDEMSSWKRKDLVALLIKNGVDVNVKNGKKLPPLHYAVTHNNPDTVKLLAEKGADINFVDEYGYSSLIRALVRISDHKYMESEKKKCQFQHLSGAVG